jgi:hypothetical protein
MKCSRLQNASLQLQVLMQVLILILRQQPLLRKPPAQVLLDSLDDGCSRVYS